VKIIIPTLSALIIAFLAFGGLWLYAQQATRPPSMAPTTGPPSPASTAQVITSGTPSANLSSATTTPTVGTPVPTPSLITVNTSSPVTVTVQITDPTLIPGSVNLLLLGATGTQPAILGVMQSIGNGIYSLQTVFNETAPGQLQLEVSAAFQGQLRRVLSNVADVNVWNHLTDANTRLSFDFPPMDTSITIYSAPATATSAATLDVAAFDPLLKTFVPLLGITVDTNPTGLTLQQWFEQKVDINGLLLTSDAAQQQQLSNGLSAIFISGQIPDQYLMLGAPVSGAYVMSPSGENVLIIDQPEDANLADFGTSTQEIWVLLPTILGSLTF
jgi:hypothetical protein